MNKKPKLVLLLSILSICIVGIVYSATLLLQPKPDYFTQEEIVQHTFLMHPILVIKPLLTANAYTSPGFYDYYKGNCDESCLTVQINKDAKYDYQSSKNLIDIFTQLNAKMITDYELHQNTDILKDYERIVVLHNEYVTFEIFTALQEHPNVIYLYPNALYGWVQLNGDQMTLIRGHNYPYDFVTNGFVWEHDNSELELDNKCKDLQWIKIPNGYQLNCYPEKQILNHKEVFDFIRNYE